jgi:hypothetical protein
LELGIWDVHGLMRDMSSLQLSEWMAYERLDPFGQYREDYRAGIIAATIANANRSKKSKPFTPEQFIPTFESETEGESEIDVINAREAVKEKVLAIKQLFAQSARKNKSGNPS